MIRPKFSKSICRMGVISNSISLMFERLPPFEVPSDSAQLGVDEASIVVSPLTLPAPRSFSDECFGSVVFLVLPRAGVPGHSEGSPGPARNPRSATLLSSNPSNDDRLYQSGSDQLPLLDDELVETLPFAERSVFVSVVFREVD